MDKIATAIGLNVRRSRKRLRLSQTELARRAGLSRPSLTNIELGERKPSLESLLRIAGAIGVRPSTLLAGVKGE